jgi:hypothetical protein
MANFGLQKLDLFSRPAAPHLQQSIDDRIQINLALVSHDVPPLARNGEEEIEEEKVAEGGREGEKETRGGRDASEKPLVVSPC